MKNKTLLVSIPRSGYNLTRYCIEYLTNRRTPGSNTRLISKGDTLFDHSHDYNVNFDGYDKIILLIRNYNEIFLRPNVGAGLDGLDNIVNTYYTFLGKYDKFNGEKMLIKYENLLSDLNIIKKLINFISTPIIKDFNEFIDNEEFHRKQALKIGNKYNSDAKSSDFYQNNNKNNKQLLLLDKKFIEHNNILYEKYLSEYKLK